MSSDTRIIKAAINPNFVDKLPRDNDKRFHAEGWQNGEWTLDDFAQCIKNGWAYCPQLKGSRKKENFLCSNIISVDVDSGQSIDETLNDPFVVDHLALIYTTASHTSDYSRFRLIFILDRDIEDRDEQVSLNQALAYRFNGDRRATDPTRVFYGNTQSEPQVFDGILTDEVLAPLLEVSKNPYKDNLYSDAGISKRSDFRLDPSYLVSTGNGNQITLAEVTGHVAIKCPFHPDRNPSAFVKRDPSGFLFLHCVKCRQTWFEKSDTDNLYRNEIYPDFVGTLKSLEDFNKIHPKINNFLLRKFKADEEFSRHRVIFTNDEHFSLDKIHKGIMLVKSPKGSGKTSSLPEVMSPLLSRTLTLEDIEMEDVGTPPRSFSSDYRVLLIGHRQALIRDLCARLNLNCYLDDELDTVEPFNLRVRRYGVCLDSLWRVNQLDFDLIIFDESEQVFSHFLAKTFNRNQWTFNLLTAMIKRTPSIIALDADLGWTTYLTLCRMKDQHSMVESIDNQIRIYINEHIAPTRQLEVFDSKIHLTNKLKEDIAAGKRVFVASNSKKLIDYLFNASKEVEKDHGKLICITSDNSKNKDIQNFILNVKSESKKYTGIFSSPSLGTGVDITFEDNLELIDCVYGFFEGGVTTHTEIDQHLARVRHPKSVRCWISKRTFNFETDFDVISSDLLLNHVAGNTSVLINPVMPEELFKEDDPFLTMASLIVSQHRHSINNLYENFLDYKAATGWDSQIIQKDEEESLLGSAFLKRGKSITLQERIDLLLNAMTLEQFEFDDISNRIESNEWISSHERASFLRTAIEKFYRQKISADLIEFDGQKNVRSGIRRFEQLKSQAAIERTKEFLGLEKRRTQQLKILEDKDSSIVLLVILLMSAGVYRNYVFNTDIEYTAEDLGRFIKISSEYKALQEGQFQLTVQRNIHLKPTEHLSKLLKLVGLNQKICRRVADGAKRTNIYHLVPDRLKQLSDIVAQRDLYRDNPWDFINDAYGFSPHKHSGVDDYLERGTYPRFNSKNLTAERTNDEKRQRRRSRGRNNSEKVIENRIPPDISQLPKS